jgi:carbon storage regulator CsrA
MALTLTRRIGESLILVCKEIGPIKVTIKGRGNHNLIKVSIEAPNNVRIFREELISGHQEERRTEPHGNY